MTNSRETSPFSAGIAGPPLLIELCSLISEESPVEKPFGFGGPPGCNLSPTRGQRQDVIASAAKQSPSRQVWRLLRRFTPRNDMIDENICPVKLKDYK